MKSARFVKSTADVQAAGHLGENAYWERIEPDFNPLLESYRNTRFYMEKVIRGNLADASADEIETALRRIGREQGVEEQARDAK